MTAVEWEKLCAIETAVARIEERLDAHCREEERGRLRVARVVPWLALVVATASPLLGLLVHR